MISLNELPDLEILKGKENELNWEPRDRLITALTAFFNDQRAHLDYSLAGMSTFSGSFADLRASFQALPANDARFIISGWIKNYYEDIMLILHTPRTQLSIRTCTFIGSFAVFLGPGLFDGFAENSLSHLIKLSGTTKKIIANAAAEVAKNIATLIVPQRSFPILVNGALDKNVNSRLRSFECLKIISERAYEDSSATLAYSIYQKIWENAVEKVLPKGIGDANSEIRSVSLSIFLIFKDKTPDLSAKFMEKLDQSTKKQLSLLLAKTTVKVGKPIVSSVPLAHIRKAILKDHSDSSPSKDMLSPLSKTSPSRSLNSKSPSPSKLFTPSTTLTSPKSTVIIEAPSCDVPMDDIQAHVTSPVLCSPTRSVQELIQTFDDDRSSPMKINSQSCDIFVDAQSEDNFAMIADEEEEEIILNVPNASYNPANSLEGLTKDLPKKLEFSSSNNKSTTPLRHSVSSPSIPLRIKTLGLASGTPLRAFYRNASELDLNSGKFYSGEPESFQFSSNNSLLIDLIEEFCNTKDVGCFEKILSMTLVRSGDFDGLTSNLISKLFQNLNATSTITNNQVDLKLKLLKNFLRNESFLLSSSGKEIIEILEELPPDTEETTTLIKSICQSNLSQVFLENCIEICYERISEFKLMLLAEFIKNYVGNSFEFKDQLQKSITPLLLALNHPNLNMRRLSINCFLAARTKLNGNTENILQLLDESRISLAQRRTVEEFLRQF